MSKQKLELTWIGKDKHPKPDPRIMLEGPLFNRQDEVEAQRNDLISQLEAQLQQQVEDCTLFTVEWELV